MDNIIIYRGQEYANWELEPSIKRKTVHTILRESESDYYARLLEQEYLLGIKTTISSNRIRILAKAQHYGFPTRLIDFTYDKDIASYFASKPSLIVLDGEHKLSFNEQGKLFTLKTNKTYSTSINSKRVNRKIEIAFGDFYNSELWYEPILKSENIISPGRVNSLINDITTPSIIGNDIISNDISYLENKRLHKQNGCFILPGNVIVRNIDYLVRDQIMESRLLNELNLKVVKSYDARNSFSIFERHISPESKRIILVNLIAKGITRSSLFPDENDSIDVTLKLFQLDKIIDSYKASDIDFLIKLIFDEMNLIDFNLKSHIDKLKGLYKHDSQLFRNFIAFLFSDYKTLLTQIYSCTNCSQEYKNSLLKESTQFLTEILNKMLQI